MLDVIQNPKFIIEIAAPRARIIMDVPSKRDYLRILQGVVAAQDLIEKYGIYAELPPLTESTSEKFLSDYLDALKEYRDTNMDFLVVPEKMNFSGKKDVKVDFPILTHADAIVYEHSGLDFIKQLDMLTIVEFWLLLADAIKIKLSQTEKGREYLHDSYMDMHKISTIKPNI